MTFNWYRTLADCAFNPWGLCGRHYCGHGLVRFPGALGPRKSLALGVSYERVNAAWTVMVLFIDAMPIWLQVSPKSARLTSTSASSQISAPSDDETLASNDSG